MNKYPWFSFGGIYSDLCHKDKSLNPIAMYRYILFPVIFAWMSMLCGISQIRTISGVITDANGNPLPGVSVLIKGTQTGTITDINGYYSIDAPVGSTLVFSYVGYLNKEMQVTPETSSSNNTESNPTGINDESDKISLFRPNDLRGVKKGVVSIDQGSNFYRNRLIRKTDDLFYNYYSSLKWRIDGHAEISISADWPLHNLKLQKTYAQGRNEDGNFVYRGPETGEIFSWGPPVKNLEYSDTYYPFDFRGQLVHKGTGNGKPALTFDSLNLFKTGYKTTQKLHLIAGNNWSKIVINYYHTCFSGIIPSSRMQEHNMGLMLNHKIRKNISADLSLRYLVADANLMNSFSQSRIYAMAVRTPVTFDNTNGLTKAADNPNAYLTLSGTQRSFAPALADNPFWLINTINDNEKNDKILGIFKLKAAPFKGVEMYMSAIVNRQYCSNKFGFKPGTAFYTEGILVNRNENYNTMLGMAGTSLNKSFGNHSMNVFLNYQANYVERILKLRNNNASENPAFKNNSSRMSRQLSLTGNYNYAKGLTVSFATSAYNSSTYKKICWMPMAGMALRPSEWMRSGIVSFWKIDASWSETNSEAPLQYRRGMMNSTLFTAAEIDRYFETEEITNHNFASPEKTMNLEIGTELSMFSKKFDFSFYWYNKKINDYIYPVYIAGTGFTPINTGDLATTGIDVDISYVLYSFYPRKWEIAFNFHKFSTLVKKVNNTDEIILGGFSDVSSCMIKGQPYGIIKGSAYLRDDKGRMIIGSDGFPMVDQQKRIIGNPNPDWCMGIENKFLFKQFSVIFLIDFRKGGDIWNGTRNTLNYLGLGRETESVRNTRDFIFDGVFTDGQVNNVPVSFCDPSLPLEENRWVRYGYAGVAEDAIEDGSFFRLKEFRFIYYRKRSKNVIHKLQLEIFVSNLFCISRYKGVCPYNSLFAFSNNAGFDFFNLPSVCTYGTSIKIIF
jgi:hypothetical protein